MLDSNEPAVLDDDLEGRARREDERMDRFLSACEVVDEPVDGPIHHVPRTVQVIRIVHDLDGEILAYEGLTGICHTRWHMGEMEGFLFRGEPLFVVGDRLSRSPDRLDDSWERELVWVLGEKYSFPNVPDKAFPNVPDKAFPNVPDKAFVHVVE